MRIAKKVPGSIGRFSINPLEKPVTPNPCPVVEAGGNIHGMTSN